MEHTIIQDRNTILGECPSNGVSNELETNKGHCPPINHKSKECATYRLVRGDVLESRLIVIF